MGISRLIFDRQQRIIYCRLCKEQSTRNNEWKPLKAIVRKRVEETVFMSPGVDQEVRMQNVEAIASATSHMTTEQLRAFHQQHHALVADVTARQAEQRAMVEQLLQCHLVRKQYHTRHIGED